MAAPLRSGLQFSVYGAGATIEALFRAFGSTPYDVHETVRDALIPVSVPLDPE